MDIDASPSKTLLKAALGAGAGSVVAGAASEVSYFSWLAVAIVTALLIRGAAHRTLLAGFLLGAGATGLGSSLSLFLSMPACGRTPGTCYVDNAPLTLAVWSLLICAGVLVLLMISRSHDQIG
jgi:hypothetical protein